MEVLKYAQRKTVAKFRNTFSNLALPLFTR
jgi:hypothetical protein